MRPGGPKLIPSRVVPGTGQAGGLQRWGSNSLGLSSLCKQGGYWPDTEWMGNVSRAVRMENAAGGLGYHHVLLCGEKALLELEACPWSYRNSTPGAKTPQPALFRMNHSFLLCLTPV